MNNPHDLVSTFVPSNEIRARFSRAMSEMYRNEVPQYGTLIGLVADINAKALDARPEWRASMEQSGEFERLHDERHGAIRVGTAAELHTLRRLFAVMGMEPVGYYDLSVAGVPVHSTAFRPVAAHALRANPFRVFTSLLRLELVDDPALREQAAAILARRRIFTPRVLALIAQSEAAGGLTHAEAGEFVTEALETFRWHGEATVDADTYDALQKAHRLVADVVCFNGPHINHLTPRTLDIDAAQAAMSALGMEAKDVVEGPPRRHCPILLRQTSFKALQETVRFAGQQPVVGAHTARFGEIEQRGVALTRKGRELYDRLLAKARDSDGPGSGAAGYDARLSDAFRQFPDTHDELRAQGLAFYRYALTAEGVANADNAREAALQTLIDKDWARAEPILYEDFLPVSAAGIFQSNLGGEQQKRYQAAAARQAFEADLGARVHDEIALYEALQQQSIDQLFATLRGRASHDRKKT